MLILAHEAGKEYEQNTNPQDETENEPLEKPEPDTRSNEQLSSSRKKWVYPLAVILALLLITGGIFAYIHLLDRQDSTAEQTEEDTTPALSSDYKMFYSLAGENIDGQPYFLSSLDGSSHTQLDSYYVAQGDTRDGANYYISPDGQHILRNTGDSIDIAEASDPENFTELYSNSASHVIWMNDNQGFIYSTVDIRDEPSVIGVRDIAYYEADVDGSPERLIFEETKDDLTSINILHVDREEGVIYRTGKGSGGGHVEGLTKRDLEDGSQIGEELLSVQDMHPASFARDMSRAAVIRSDSDSEDAEVVLVDLANGEEAVIYEQRDNPLPIASSLLPYMSPDGNFVAIWNREVDEDTDQNEVSIHLYDVASGQSTTLIDDAEYDNLLVEDDGWTPDSSHIFLRSHCTECLNRSGEELSSDDIRVHYLVDVETQEMFDFELPSSYHHTAENDEDTRTILNEPALRGVTLQHRGWIRD